MAGSIDELSVEPDSAVTQPEVPMTVEELDQILKLQQDVFASVARNDDHLSIIAQICDLAEGFLPNAVASVMLVDPQTGLMNVLSAPSVPQQGVESLRGLQPGKRGGSCGNAVFSNMPVYVQDTFTDPRWVDLRQIAYDFNLCSCWSNPVRNEKLKRLVLSLFLPLSTVSRLLFTNVYWKLVRISSVSYWRATDKRKIWRPAVNGLN